jgi:hypothetical protein
MLQSCFVGKAAEVYLALSSEQSSDYDIVKKEILKAYELVSAILNFKQFSQKVENIYQLPFLEI